MNCFYHISSKYNLWFSIKVFWPKISRKNVTSNLLLTLADESEPTEKKWFQLKPHPLARIRGTTDQWIILIIGIIDTNYHLLRLELVIHIQWWMLPSIIELSLIIDTSRFEVVLMIPSIIELSLLLYVWSWYLC